MAKERPKIPIAVHLFLLDGDKVLLLRRFNTGYEDGNYSVPAGHLDGDEEVRVATAREALEEANVKIKTEDIEMVGVMHRVSDREGVDFFAVAKKWTGKIKVMEKDKCDDLRWFDMDDLPENTIPYIRRAIENYKAGKTFDSMGWEEAKK